MLWGILPIAMGVNSHYSGKWKLIFAIKHGKGKFINTNSADLGKGELFSDVSGLEEFELC